MKEKSSGEVGNKAPVLCVVGPSNSGKTGLMEALIKELSEKGYRIATIKHSHHSVEMDQPGKDSWRHRKAGADVSIFCSKERVAVFSEWEREPTVEELCSRYVQNVGWVLIEGFKESPYPKIVVIGDGKWDPSLWTEVKAVVSNHPCDASVPVFRPEEAKKIVGFLEHEILGHGIKRFDL